MIKILHVISDKNIGGAGKLLLNLLKEANRELFDISVILLKGSALKKKVDELGIKTILLENFGLGTLIGEIKCQSPHIVHTHAAGMARVAARLCGRIITVNTKHCSNEVIKKAPFLKRNAVRLLDIIFTDFTISTADYVRETLLLSGILPYKTAVIVNGSHALNEFSDDEIGRIKESLGYSKSDFLVGIVGRLEDGKGQEIFIHAAEICQKSNPRIKFLIVGSGSMEDRLKLLAKDLNNIKFLGFLSDVTEIMNAIDVNVNCSYISETSSLSLSEGMSVGAVPIVSDCGGNSFMARNCGIVFPKKDHRALANAIIDLEGNRMKKNMLAKESKKRFNALFTAEKMTQNTEKIYLELLEGNNHTKKHKILL